MRKFEAGRQQEVLGVSISIVGDQPGRGRKRHTIAAQACETCRSRKQRCDERRPNCGFCIRRVLACEYREPQPTKKDKTLVEILNRLKSVEGKLDEMSPSERTLQKVASQSFCLSTSSSTNSPDVSQRALSTPLFQPPHLDSVANERYVHASAAHQILLWPAMQRLLQNSSPANIQTSLKKLEQEGSMFVVRLSNSLPPLPHDEALSERPFVGMQTMEARARGGLRICFTELREDKMKDLATTYFDTFNLIYPFMERQSFFDDVLSRVVMEGFSCDATSVLALLVFALGELAMATSQGEAIDVHKRRDSGVKDGTSLRPPGLAFFNEARKHIGFVLAEGNLENIQIFSLVALYYETCFHHMEFWRFTEFASLACKSFVTKSSIDWKSPKGDLIKRMYWHCTSMETDLRLELDFPDIGLSGLEREIGVPSFNGEFCQADHQASQLSHFEAHYASQIALRRLCVYAHDAISQKMSEESSFDGLSASSLKQLATQFTEWRRMLPGELQWNEGEPSMFPFSGPFPTLSYFRQPNASANGVHTLPTLFSTRLDSASFTYPFVYDIQVALLRTRYYYAKHMVYRPFVYKALHFPELLTPKDTQGVAACIRYSLKWPILLSPTSRRKRLIPHLFCWSQNILGVLLILHMTRHNSALRDICTQHCGPLFTAESEQTMDLMIDWIRDLKSVDSVAAWCWGILQAVYCLEL